MEKIPTVAIIGSPNVGKSTLFNRIIGKRHAIIDDERGITRDRLYARTEWIKRKFNVIDTGGLEIEDVPFQRLIKEQVNLAIEEADVIVFVVDGLLGLIEDDYAVARLLRNVKKPVILAVNKIDDNIHIGNIGEFYALGFNDVIAVSSEHGIGIGDLLDKIVSYLPEKEIEEYKDAITFSVIGQPNVGKSSLINALINEERVIVSNKAGTTRDAIDIEFNKDRQNYVIIDTAGLKKRGRIIESVDRYAALRAFKAIERSDVVLFLLDANEGIRAQDKHVAGFAIDENKAIIIIVNKWDLIKKDDKTLFEYRDKIRAEFKFIEYAPIIFVSAKTKQRVNEIFGLIKKASEAYKRRIATNALNGIIQDAQLLNEPAMFNGGRLRIYYVSQVAIEPPTFVFFVNNPNFVHFSYERYLENKIREAFDFDGTPIKLIFRERR